MSQSRMASFIEANTNVAVGFLISLVYWTYVIVPWYGLTVSFADNLAITMQFTVLAIWRGFVVRRYFNKKG